MSESINVGDIVRSLRQSRKLSGNELAKRAGMSQSKVSKIETGTVTKLKIPEVEKLLTILDAPVTIQQQVARTMNSPTSNPQKISGKHSYAQILALEHQTKQIQLYSHPLIPAVFQTPAYREALLNYLAITRDLARERQKITLERQDMIWDKRRRYHVLLHESVLS